MTMRKIAGKLMRIAILCGLTACTANAQEQLPDTSGRFVRYAGGMSVRSEILGENVAFDILLPADYTDGSAKEYPVVYMLHGYGDDNKAWNDKWLRIESKVEELEADGLEPMIYVFPDGSNSYYSNTYDGKFRYMDMFVSEFVPYIDRTYRTIADREHRAVVGYSMGGFGAMVLPMKHPEMFSISVPLSMSFRTDEQYMSEPQNGWNSQWGSIFGGVGSSGEGRITEYYKEHCPFYQFIPENKEILSQVRWFLHCGDDEEQLLIANDDLHVQMHEYGFAHEYRVGDGAHTSDYWRNTLDEVLPYIQFVMNGGTDWQWTDMVPDVQEVELGEDGTFASAAYSQNQEAPATAFYIVYEGFDDSLVKDIISVIQRGITSRPYMILPCDVSEKPLADWIAGYESEYGIGGSPEYRQAAAFGEGGRETFGCQSMFSRLYFDDADLTGGNGEVQAIEGIFYYIGQTDDDRFCRDMGALYKSCKALDPDGADFEYRVRNSSDDIRKSVLEGVEKMKPEIRF